MWSGGGGGLRGGVGETDVQTDRAPAAGGWESLTHQSLLLAGGVQGPVLGAGFNRRAG